MSVTYRDFGKSGWFSCALYSEKTVANLHHYNNFLGSVRNYKKFIFMIMMYCKDHRTFLKGRLLSPPEMLAFQNPYWYSFVSLSGWIIGELIIWYKRRVKGSWKVNFSGGVYGWYSRDSVDQCPSAFWNPWTLEVHFGPENAGLWTEISAQEHTKFLPVGRVYTLPNFR